MNNYKILMNDINTFIFDVDGVLTDGKLTIHPDGSMIRNMSAKDGYAIQIAKKRGYNICIITAGESFTIYKRLKDLGINNIYLKIENKKKKFQEYCFHNNIYSGNVLYMGDDIPDIQIMECVKLPCAPVDAVEEVKAVSKYISPKKGGYGCVRDVIEQTLKIQNKWI